MPELPEVETLRRDLSRLYAGDRLLSLTVTGRRTVRRHRPELLAALEGRELAGVGRLGKYLWFRWDDSQVLVAHLRMSGQLLALGPEAPALPHTHALFAFARAGELRFVDPRTFGELFLSEGTVPVELGHLGPDALQAGPAYLRRALAGRRAPLKSLLVDQRVVAGIGNIYADEICFDARLRPDRPGGSLRPVQVSRLAGSVRTVLEAAIEARGSTLADRQYRDLLGEAGHYQLEHKVYGRSGMACVSCGRAVERVRFGAKSAFSCPRCQR